MLSDKVRSRQKEWYAENREAILERKRESRRLDREKFRERERAAQKRWYEKNRDTILARKRAQRAANWEKEREQDRQRYEQHRQKISDQQKARYAKNPFRRYGLSPEQHASLIAEQGGLCSICQRETTLIVDHDHVSGRVRALLCRRCNSDLAWLENQKSVAKLEQMREYLRKHGSLK